MQGSDSFLQDQPEQTSTEVVTNDFVTPATPTTPKPAVLDVARTEADRLAKIRHRIEAALEKQGLRQDVKMSIDDRGLVISMVSRHVVFPANVAQLSPRGQAVVDALAPVLRKIPDDLRVDGHTNQVKVHPKYYATDWDLSAARAVSVLRRLDEVDGVPAKRLSVAAFGHERPLVDPSKPGSQQVNKRVDIVVLSPVSEEARALLGSVGGHPTRTRTGEETRR